MRVLRDSRNDAEKRTARFSAGRPKTGPSPTNLIQEYESHITRSGWGIHSLLTRGSRARPSMRGSSAYVAGPPRTGSAGGHGRWSSNSVHGNMSRTHLDAVSESDRPH